MQEMDRIFRGIDVLVAPLNTGHMTIIGNMTGHPALTIRASFTALRTREMPAFLHAEARQSEGPPHDVPHPITLMSGLFDEAAALTLGRALEAYFGIAERRPPVK